MMATSTTMVMMESTKIIMLVIQKGTCLQWVHNFKPTNIGIDGILCVQLLPAIVSKLDPRGRQGNEVCQGNREEN